MTLNRPPEFCLKLTYMYLLKADHVSGNTWGGTIFDPNGILVGRGPPGDATYQISRLYLCLMVLDKNTFFMIFPYTPI